MKINNPEQYSAFFWAENKVTHAEYGYTANVFGLGEVAEPELK